MFKCPTCGTTFDHITAILSTTFKAYCYITYDHEELTLAMERRPVSQGLPKVVKLLCRDCGFSGTEKTWHIIVRCYRCGTHLSEGLKKDVAKVAKEYFCTDLGGAVCHKCYDTRYGPDYCDSCTFMKGCILGKRGVK